MRYQKWGSRCSMKKSYPRGVGKQGFKVSPIRIGVGARLMSQAHEPGQLAEPLYTRNRKGHANDRARSAHRARARARSIRRSKAEILTFPTSSHTYPGDTIQRISPQPLAGQGDSRPARRLFTVSSRTMSAQISTFSPMKKSYPRGVGKANHAGSRPHS